MRLVHCTYPAFRAVAPALRGFQPTPSSGFESEVDRLFGAAFADRVGAASPARIPVDLCEDKANTFLRAELPGVGRDDIKVELTDGTLTITSTRKAPAVEGRAAESLALQRTLRLGDDVNREKISARYENGVLTVTLPKPEGPTPKTITVAVQ